jgi:hypothetical protein
MPELTEERVDELVGPSRDGGGYSARTASWNTRLFASLESAALISADAVAVLLVGSRALGWQHARSDFDMVVVTTEPWPGMVTDRQRVELTEGTIGIVTTTVDGVRCEVKYWTERQIQETLAKLTWSAWDAGTTGQSMSQNESVLVERLPSAVALSGEAWSADIAEQVRASAARSQFALACLTLADDALGSVSGLLEAGDVGAAVVSAQQAFVHVTDALTASLGCPGTKSKWRLRRVEAVGSDVLSVAQFWRITTMRDFDPQRPQDWVDLVVFRCGQIMLDVRLGR